VFIAVELFGGTRPKCRKGAERPLLGATTGVEYTCFDGFAKPAGRRLGVGTTVEIHADLVDVP
jgi:hypothetical protein